MEEKPKCSTGVGQRCAVVKLTAKINKRNINEYCTKEVIKSDDYYKQVSNPFFRFMYEEIEKQRGENQNEKTENE